MADTLPNPVEKAARWLAATPEEERPHPLIVYLKRTFDLSAKEVCLAIRESHSLKTGVH